jgi:hypothetical protein
MAERYIVRFRGSAPAKEITARLHADPDVQVVEETSRMVLVEAKESELRRVIQEDQDVVAIVPERHYERPDSRPSIIPDIPDPSDKSGHG